MLLTLQRSLLEECVLNREILPPTKTTSTKKERNMWKREREDQRRTEQERASELAVLSYGCPTEDKTADTIVQKKRFGEDVQPSQSRSLWRIGASHLVNIGGFKRVGMYILIRTDVHGEKMSPMIPETSNKGRKRKAL